MPEESRPIQDSPQQPEASPRSTGSFRSALRKIGMAVAFLIVGGGAVWWGIYFLGSPVGVDGFNESKRTVTERRLQEALSPLAARVDKLESQVRGAEAAGDNGLVVDEAERHGGRESDKRDVQEAKTFKKELAHSRNDILALAADINAMKESLRQTGDLAVQSQRAFRNLLSSAMMLERLRERASAGYPFAQELAAFRASAVTHEGAQAALVELDRHAAQGAPALETLKRQLAELSGPVARAIEKAHARDWWQRVLVALQGVVSIRSEQGGVAAGALERADAALSAGDAGQALAEVEALEPTAREVLRAWQGQLESRLAVDLAVERLIALSLGAASESDAPKAAARHSVKSPEGEADTSAEQP